MKKEITFALFFANRGFFPGEGIASARDDMKNAVKSAGYNYICMDEEKTRYGAVETIAEGKLYAEFLKENEGRFQGIIVSLPNFGDENGALVALKDANVPILIQAYPDELGKMDFAHRRDSFCGKFAICNVLRQAEIPFTVTEQFVIDPKEEAFSKEIKRFAGICRVVDGMRSFNVGAIGARTTAFKTVRYDEVAFQKKGINIDAIDLSEVFSRMKKIKPEQCLEKKSEILNITAFANYPEEKLEKLACLQQAFEDIVRDYQLQAVAIRCWNEFETEIGIAPCVCLSLLNEMGICAACEVDVTNAVMMRALSLAADRPVTLLDFNNNYGREKDKAIMFHCGPVPISMTEGKGEIVEHLMFKKSFGEQSGVGVLKNKLLSGNVTVGSLKSENGKLSAFVFEGEFTDDSYDDDFFGVGRVIQKDNINDIANFMSYNGYKHHLCVAFGNHMDIILEAFNRYLGYDTLLIK